MKLVMFLDACEHIARIARIIRQPSGNALLLGVGGSGRQSLSRMATFISAYKIFQIEVVKNYSMKFWREDVKRVLMQAGVENKPVTFLFVDTQIINEQMLEDINNVLNSGDVTGIYVDKDFEDINQACKADCLKQQLQPNKNNVFSVYLQRVKKNIHLIIAMSPLSDMFQTRIRMFPSLVNCCTIDWFSEWPEEALVGVGRGSLMDQDQDLGIDGQIDTLVDMFKNIHKSVERASSRFLAELRRPTYVTPTSFLELLNLFKSILFQKSEDLKQQVKRLSVGLEKLNSANVAVSEMKVKLTAMQPELEKKSKATEEMMVTLNIDKQAAELQQKQVSEQEAVATEQANEAKQLADEAEAKVFTANLELEKTLALVRQLKKEQLVEIKSFTSPSPAIILVLQAVVYLCIDQIKSQGGDLITGMENGKKVVLYFETAKRYLLNDPKALLDMLINFDKTQITQKMINNLEKDCFSREEFNMENAKKSSIAAAGLFAWVKAMFSFYKVYTETEPLRIKLGEMKIIVDTKTAELNAAKAVLKQVNDRIAELEKMFNEKVAEKDALVKEINSCEVQLDRA